MVELRIFIGLLAAVGWYFFFQYATDWPTVGIVILSLICGLVISVLDQILWFIFSGLDEIL